MPVSELGPVGLQSSPAPGRVHPGNMESASLKWERMVQSKVTCI
jgi:hypothetical protein